MLHTLVMIGFIAIVIALIIDIWELIVEWLIYIAMFVIYGYAFYSIFIKGDKWFY